MKNVLLTEAIDSIQKLVKKGKGLNKQIIEDRQSRVSGLFHRHRLADCWLCAGAHALLRVWHLQRLKPMLAAMDCDVHSVLPLAVLQVQELVEKIYAIPDGMSLAANKRPNRVRRQRTTRLIVCHEMVCPCAALLVCPQHSEPNYCCCACCCSTTNWTRGPRSRL